MAYALQASRRNILRAGTYRFSKEHVDLIYKLHDRDAWTLWDIKDIYFTDATLEQLAIAVSHGRMDADNIPFSGRPRHTFDPSMIVLEEFNVGDPPPNGDNPSKKALSINK